MPGLLRRKDPKVGNRSDVTLHYPLFAKMTGLYCTIICMAGFTMIAMGRIALPLYLRLLFSALVLCVIAFYVLMSMNMMNWRVQALESHMVIRSWNMRERIYHYGDIEDLRDPFTNLGQEIINDKFIYLNATKTGAQRYEVKFPDMRVVIPFDFQGIEPFLKQLWEYAKTHEDGLPQDRVKRIYDNYIKAEERRKSKKNKPGFYQNQGEE